MRKLTDTHQQRLTKVGISRRWPWCRNSRTNVLQHTLNLKITVQCWHSNASTCSSVISLYSEYSYNHSYAVISARKLSIHLSVSRITKWWINFTKVMICDNHLGKTDWILGWSIVLILWDIDNICFQENLFTLWIKKVSHKDDFEMKNQEAVENITTHGC